ncbi:MAG: sigma-70 family RNA polymerase sigma factor [Gemmataceae bacterium]|nr:sigma-70 family RNA polymerase sigma factor [Gemmataceae bacterium]
MIDTDHELAMDEQDAGSRPKLTPRLIRRRRPTAGSRAPAAPRADCPEPSDHEPSDHELLKRFRDGSQEAATRIYLRYARRLHALAKTRCSEQLAKRVAPEDIVQSVFRTFFRRVARDCYDVPDGEELWKLFLVIALNKIRDEHSFHFAAKRDVRLAKGSASLERLAATTSGQDPRSRLNLEMVIQEAMDQLPPAYRRMIELRIEGHEVAAIAAATGRSKRTVERTLQEFRTKLNGLLAVEDA